MANLIKTGLSIITFSTLLLSATTSAQDNGRPFRIVIGGSTNSFDSSIQVNADDTRLSGAIDLEDDLGYDSNLGFGYAKMDYQINPDHKIALTLAPYKRDSTLIINRDIQYQDDTILAGATVSSTATSYIYDIEYGYLVSSDPSYDLYLLAGIYWIDTKFEINVTGDIEIAGGQQSFEADYERKNSADIPLPLFGFSYVNYFHRNWQFTGSIRYFKSHIEHVDGEVTTAFSSIEYQPSDRWGVGGALYYFDTDVVLGKDTYNGKLNWQYSGANLYVFFEF